MAAIWKDYFLTFNATSRDFRICTDGYGTGVIYTGRAVAKPGATTVSVRINDICADYLRERIPDFGASFDAAPFQATFYVQSKATTATNWSNTGTVTFTNDWSYDYDYDASRDGYSFPISNRADARQVIPLTVPAGVSSVTATLTNSDGYTFQVIIPTAAAADFNDDFNDDYALEAVSNTTGGVAMLDLTPFPDVVKVVFGGNTWIVDRRSCAEYAIYYVNAYGGWDMLLVSAVRTDNYTRHEYAVAYDNNDPSAVGKVDYLNEVEERYTLRTGILTDLGGSRMHHLVGTTTAMLKNLSTGRAVPVTIEADSVTYKTFRSEGRRPVMYEFDVIAAQDRIRR